MTVRSGQLWLLGLVALGCTKEEGTTAEDAPPTAVIISHFDGQAFLQDQPATVEGSVADSEDPAEALDTRWLLGEAPACEEAAAADGHTSCLLTPAAGDSTITLQVTDRAGQVASDTISIVVTQGSAPSATILSPPDLSEVIADEAFVLQGAAADTEDPPNQLQATWHTSASGVFAKGPVGAGGETSATATLPVGTHAITLSITDTTGLSATDTITVEALPPDQAPSAPELVWSPDLPIAGYDDLACLLSVESVDPEGLPVSYSFDFTEDGVPIAAELSTELPGDTLSRDQLVPEATYTCSVRGYDGALHSEPSTITTVAQQSTCDEVGPAECDGVNTKGSFGVATISPSVHIAFRHTIPFDMLVRELSVHTGGCTGASQVSLYSHDPGSDGPGSQVAAGDFTVDYLSGWQGAQLDDDVEVAAGETWWIVWHTPPQTCDHSRVSSGTTVEYKTSSDGASWAGPYSNLEAFKLHCCE